MRTLARPLVLFAIISTITTIVQSQDEGGTGTGGVGPFPGTNFLLFTQGYPVAITGGVSVGLTIQPTTGYTCTSVTISIVDANTSQTLASITLQNPGSGQLIQNFYGLGSGVAVQVVVNSVFQCGAQFDFPYLEADVTTK
jgi:hypothetical protein